MERTTWTVGMCVLLCITGCVDPEARTDCEQFCAAIGEQATRCDGTDVTTLTTNHCLDLLNCARVVRVSSKTTFPTCLQNIATAQCVGVGVTPPLPVECQGQFNY